MMKKKEKKLRKKEKEEKEATAHPPFSVVMRRVSRGREVPRHLA